MRKTIGLCLIFLVLAMFLSAGTAKAQTHDESPFKTPGSAQIEYTIKLLKSNFPDDLDLIGKLNVFIFPCHETQAATWWDGDSPNMKICSELIDVLDGDDEYVAVLGHEFGHIKLGHEPAYKVAILHQLADFYPSLIQKTEEDPPPYIPSTSANSKFALLPDYEILNKQEPEADAFSVAALRKNMRDAGAMQRVLKKLAAIDGWYRKEPTETDELGKKRIAALENECPRPKN